MTAVMSSEVSVPRETGEPKGVMEPQGGALHCGKATLYALFLVCLNVGNSSPNQRQ
jgi:hypothetical protein